MIDFISCKAPENPAVIEAVIALLTDAFGEEEGALERRQLSGQELGKNDDYLFTAWEDGTLLSTIHLTVVHDHPEFGCLGGLITNPAARGKGLADRLFGMACEKFDALGGELLFLGTNNSMAARFYARHGFSFITGTNVMYRIPGKSIFDAHRTYYAPGEYTCAPCDDSCRVPIVTLITARGRDMLMDTNANIVSTDYLTQISCTGLYPRFLKIMENGDVWCARLKNGAVCAMCTAVCTDSGAVADAFAFPGFEDAVPELLASAQEKYGHLTIRIADADTEKAAQFAALGFVSAGKHDYEFRGLHIPCTAYKK